MVNERPHKDKSVPHEMFDELAIHKVTSSASLETLETELMNTSSIDDLFQSTSFGDIMERAPESDLAVDEATSTTKSPEAASPCHSLSSESNNEVRNRSSNCVMSQANCKVVKETTRKATTRSKTSSRRHRPPSNSDIAKQSSSVDVMSKNVDNHEAVETEAKISSRANTTSHRHRRSSDSKIESQANRRSSHSKESKHLDRHRRPSANEVPTRNRHRRSSDSDIARREGRRRSSDSNISSRQGRDQKERLPSDKQKVQGGEGRRYRKDDEVVDAVGLQLDSEGDASLNDIVPKDLNVGEEDVSASVGGMASFSEFGSIGDFNFSEQFDSGVFMEALGYGDQEVFGGGSSGKMASGCESSPSLELAFDSKDASPERKQKSRRKSFGGLVDIYRKSCGKTDGQSGLLSSEKQPSTEPNICPPAADKAVELPNDNGSPKRGVRRRPSLKDLMFPKASEGKAVEPVESQAASYAKKILQEKIAKPKNVIEKIRKSRSFRGLFGGTGRSLMSDDESSEDASLRSFAGEVDELGCEKGDETLEESENGNNEPRERCRHHSDHNCEEFGPQSKRKSREQSKTSRRSATGFPRSSSEKNVSSSKDHRLRRSSRKLSSQSDHVSTEEQTAKFSSRKLLGDLEKKEPRRESRRSSGHGRSGKDSTSHSGAHPKTSQSSMKRSSHHDNSNTNARRSRSSEPIQSLTKRSSHSGSTASRRKHGGSSQNVGSARTSETKPSSSHHDDNAGRHTDKSFSSVTTAQSLETGKDSTAKRHESAALARRSFRRSSSCNTPPVA